MFTINLITTAHNAHSFVFNFKLLAQYPDSRASHYYVFCTVLSSKTIMADCCVSLCSYLNIISVLLFHIRNCFVLLLYCTYISYFIS